MPPGADPYYGISTDQHTNEDLLKITKWLESKESFSEEEEKFFTKYIEGFKKKQQEKIENIKGDVVKLVHFPDEKIEAFGDSYYKQYFAGPTLQDYYFSSFKVMLNKNVAHHVVLHFSSNPFPERDAKGHTIDPAFRGVKLYENFPEPVTGMSSNGKIRGIKFNDPNILHISPNNEIQSCSKGGTYFIPKGSYLNYEVHYNPSGIVEISPVDLQIFSNESNKPLPKMERFSMTLDQGTLIAKPFQKEAKVSVSYIAKKSYKMTGFGIHTHYRGRSGKMYVQYPNSKVKKLVFSYPTHQYKIKFSSSLYHELMIPKGTKITTEITYDNSAEQPSNPDPTHLIKIGPSIMNDENFLPRIFTKEF